jgi:AmmeMemoRadiSam system protein B
MTANGPTPPQPPSAENPSATQRFEDLPEHLRRPHARTIQPMPVQSRDGKMLVALRDPSMLSQQTMVVPPQVLQVVQQFRGEDPLDKIAIQVGAPVNQLVQLALALDSLGLLWGPTCEKMEASLLEKFRTNRAFPAMASASMSRDAAACRKAIDQYFAQTEDPELEGVPTAIVAPHLDYQRGWPNYAGAYFALRSTAPPDRVVILGTNHFGAGDGVVLSEFGFDSPLGRCPADSAIVDDLVAGLGKKIVIDQLDHYAEHSVQLQLPWIQHCWGDVPVVAALIPDPLTPMVADDGGRASGEQFVHALRATLDKTGGSTFFIASSDLSHVGPQFGEPRAVDDQRRFDVERHDREMMSKFLTGDAEEFLSAMKWNKNPTRWCSVGNMTALLALARPTNCELIDYRQACDDKGVGMVTSAAIALM